MPEVVDEFPIDAEIVLLNHASFGVPTTHMMAVTERIRHEIERDAAGLLSPGPLNQKLRGELAVAADFLSVPLDSLALTMNATEASSAVATSLGARGAIHVAMLDTEYPSVIRAWQLAADAHGGTVELVQLDPPVGSADAVIRAFDQQVTGSLDVVVASLVTSPTALRLPVEKIAGWASGRGAITVVDVAHGPGHLDVGVADLGASVVYGTLHKWLPVPRPLGFLYATDDVRDALHPAMVALYRDEAFAERFAWRGTWDPASALSFSAALDQWRGWQADGSLACAERMADLLSARLSACGLLPTGAGSLLPARLRGFVVPDVSEDGLQAALDDAKVRAWVGASPKGRTLLRVATHVYTTEEHVERAVAAVTEARRG